MIEHIRLSEKAKQQLIVIKRKTGIENWNVLCRWALCLSLAEESIPPVEDIPTDSSIEISWKVFAGEHHETLRSLIIYKYKTYPDNSKSSLNVFFKLHLHRGISYLMMRANTIDNILFGAA